MPSAIDAIVTHTVQSDRRIGTAGRLVHGSVTAYVNNFAVFRYWVLLTIV